MTREQAEKCTILKTLVGSTVHGLNVPDGLEDRDEMGVVVEPMSEMVKTGKPFEQFIYRSAAEREGKQDARSMAGDLDLTLYSLKKFCKLCLDGNPTVMLALFAPMLAGDARGMQLRGMAPKFVSKAAGARFLGYLASQKGNLKSTEGKGKDVNRPELIQMYGFDTKYAMHMLRLGYQGIEFLTTGKLVLPIVEPTRTFLFDVRQGKVPLADCYALVEQLENDLKAAIASSELPEEGDSEAVNAWMRYVYLHNWKSQDPYWSTELAKIRGAASPAAPGQDFLG